MLRILGLWYLIDFVTQKYCLILDKPTQQAEIQESSQQPSDAQQRLQTFWLKQTEEIQNLTSVRI